MLLKHRSNAVLIGIRDTSFWTLKCIEKKHTVVFLKTSNVFQKTSNVFSKTSNVFFKTTVCFFRLFNLLQISAMPNLFYRL